MPLFWRIFALNAVVLAAATGLVLLGPITVSTPVLLTEALILTGGLAAMLVANGVLLRVALAPLQRLSRAMSELDLLRPGVRPAVTGQREVAALIRAFHTMLDRLEAERATSTARALSAQEAERHRVARELHDEVGQTLTAVLLDLRRVAGHAPPALREELLVVQETTRGSLEEIRRIARRLRPGVLEELGLHSALRSLASEFAAASGLHVERRIDADALPARGRDAELVLYRVAQEALTNATRHAGATRLELGLRRHGGGVELRVGDDGRGIGPSDGEGAGIRGMRERALLVGATLSVTPRSAPGPGPGTEVRLLVPDGPAPDAPGTTAGATAGAGGEGDA